MKNDLIKSLYKVDLFVLKLLPVIMAVSMVIAQYGAKFEIDTGIELTIQTISHYLGFVIAPILFIYISSYVFQFCNYHRMFIHYVTIIELMNVTNWYYPFPITNVLYNNIQTAITTLFLIITIIMYIKKRRQIRLCNKPEPSS